MKDKKAAKKAIKIFSIRKNSQMAGTGNMRQGKQLLLRIAYKLHIQSINFIISSFLRRRRLSLM